MRLNCKTVKLIFPLPFLFIFEQCSTPPIPMATQPLQAKPLLSLHLGEYLRHHCAYIKWVVKNKRGINITKEDYSCRCCVFVFGAMRWEPQCEPSSLYNDAALNVGTCWAHNAMHGASPQGAASIHLAVHPFKLIDRLLAWDGDTLHPWGRFQKDVRSTQASLFTPRCILTLTATIWTAPCNCCASY